MRISLTKKLYASAAALLCLAVIVSSWWRQTAFPHIVGLIDGDTRLLLTRTLFTIAGQPVRVLFVLKVFLFLGFLALVSRLSQRLIQRLVRHHPRFDPHREYVLTRAVSFLIYAAGILIGINIEGLNLNTLIVLGGSLGVGVGFGLQSLVSNFVAGVILLIEQPVRLGDRVEFGDRTGEIVRVGGRSSWIRTYDNAVVIVPNSDLVSKQILNWTAGDRKTRLSVPVSVAQGSDLDQVMDVLLELACVQSDVLPEPHPVVLLSEIGPHATTFTIQVWTLLSADHFLGLRSRLYLQVAKRFREEKIQIPNPQLDVHVVRSGSRLRS